MSLFCCSSVRPYRPRVLDHEAKFTAFMAWAAFPQESPQVTDDSEIDLNAKLPSYAVQLVRQVNYGPLESKRYFIPSSSNSNTFIEITENSLVQGNFQKLNSYKNLKCDSHNRFFEVNLYAKDPVNKHHWRANLARPASSIDI